MIYGSVCSGIEAASVAWDPLGWECAFLSEIDPFPRAVLEHRFPHVPLRGDFTVIQRGDHADIDLLVGGTPCQSFSVAGLRGGLADDRGNLALEYLRLADRLRPRWLVWENVPGVLSSGGGRDFGAFLGGLGELGYGWAYRVLDAQYFGLAQRRRRVFVVAHSGAAWGRAAAVLLERASLSGHPAPSREAGQDPAACLTTGTGRRYDAETETLVAHTLRGEGFDASEDGTGRGTPLVPTSVALRGRDGGAAIEAGDDRAFTLRASQGGGDKPHVLLPACGSLTASTGGADENDARDGRLVPMAFNARQDPDVSGDVAHPLGAKDTGHGLEVAGAVRRLTPRECERLQGFPDDWTLVPYRGRLAADGPRYKAIGNSMAVPVMAWIGRRIAAVDALSEAA